MAIHQKPLVSVLIPAYNHDNYVKEAILSVIKQTYGYDNIQLIVTDDYSKDNTAEVICKLSEKYKFTVIKHTKNLGVCETLNKMISISDGEYIASFASDDILVSDRIENQITILKSYPNIDILAGDSVLIDEKGEVQNQYIQSPSHSLIDYNFDDFFLKKKPFFAAGTAIIKRNLFQKIGGYDTNYKVEDLYFWLKAAYNNAKIVKCNLPFLYYRVHKATVSANEEYLNQERAKVLAIYKSHPKYSKALQVREFYVMSEWIFIKKTKVILHLIKNPKLLFNKKILRIIIMLLLPVIILKRRFPENYTRHATQ